MQLPSLVDVAGMRTKDIVDLRRGSEERDDTPLDRGFDVSGRNAPGRRSAPAVHGVGISQGATIGTIVPCLRSPHDQVVADIVAVASPFLDGSRLIAFDESGVTFRYKDYRCNSADRQQVMTLATDEFIRRFLLHVLPRGVHRTRHYGLLAGSARKASIACARKLLNAAAPPDEDIPAQSDDFRRSCPFCGGRMIVIETFERRRRSRGPPGASATNRETAP